MNYNIRGEHMEVTDALKEYAERKLSRLDRYLDTPPVSPIMVTMKVVKGLQNIEVTIPLAGFVLRAVESNDDMYASIDLVVDKLERQIRKHKTKLNRKFRDGGLRELFKDSAESAAGQLLEEEDDLEVVRTKRFTLKPMDVEEAILQMNMVGHSFFVFNNMDTEEINVVYRRDDGKYGLIEPAT